MKSSSLFVTLVLTGLLANLCMVDTKAKPAAKSKAAAAAAADAEAKSFFWFPLIAIGSLLFNVWAANEVADVAIDLAKGTKGEILGMFNNDDVIYDEVVEYDVQCDDL